jgi:phytoene dehydrogenase-like protein
VNPGSNGQIGVVISDIGDAISWQANPGGGFGVPGNVLQRPVNLAYALGGTLVPGPGGVAVMMFAAAARRSRRRKSAWLSWAS